MKPENRLAGASGLVWLWPASLAVFLGLAVAIDIAVAVKLAAALAISGILYVLYSLPSVRKPIAARPLQIFYIFLTLFVAWPKYAVLKVGALPSLSPVKLMYAAVFLAWMILIIRYPDARKNFRENARECRVVFISWIIYVLTKAVSNCLLVGVPWSIILKLAAEDIFGMNFLFIVALTLIRGVNDVQRFFSVLLVALLITFLIAGVEHFTGRTPFASMISADADVSGRLAEVLATKIRDGQHRLQGSFEHPLVYGQYLAMMIPIIVVSVAINRRLFLAILLMSPIVVLDILITLKTGSRSASALSALSFGAMVAIVPLYTKDRKLTVESLLRAIGVLIFGAVLLVTLAPMLADMVAAKSVQTQQSSDARLYMMNTGVPLVLESPILGYGPGTAAALAGVVVTGGFYSIDNFYLSTALESGIVSLLGLLGFAVFGPLNSLFRSYSHGGDRNSRLLAMGGAVASLIFAATMTVLSISSSLGLCLVILVCANVCLKPAARTRQ